MQASVKVVKQCDEGFTRTEDTLALKTFIPWFLLFASSQSSDPKGAKESYFL